MANALDMNGSAGPAGPLGAQPAIQQPVQPQQQAPASPQTPASPQSPQPQQPLNVFNQSGVQGGGGFLPGPAQIQNASGPPSNVSFQPASGNPFGAQASGVYT
jgi:hypothetical protein